MRSPLSTLRELRDRRRLRRVGLPWDELEAEAERQGCSPADIFFDLAGRPRDDEPSRRRRARPRRPAPGVAIPAPKVGRTPASRKSG